MAPRVRSLAATTALLSSGCSFGMVGRPPTFPIDPSARIECTVARTAPAADSIAALGLGILGVGLVAPSPSHCESGTVCVNLDSLFQPLGVAFLGVAAIYAMSAATGFERTGACRETLDLVRACRAFDWAACKQLAVVPPSPADP